MHLNGFVSLELTYSFSVLKDIDKNERCFVNANFGTKINALFCILRSGENIEEIIPVFTTSMIRKKGTIW